VKIFIWEDVLTDYTSGMIVSYASDLADAIADVRARFGDDVANECHCNFAEIDCDNDKIPVSFCVYGGG
jgi:hypothetical protein